MRSKVPRPFGWWLDKFKNEVGADEKFGKWEELFYDPYNGFMTWELSHDGKILYVVKMCGDGRYWRGIIYKMFADAKKHGAEKLRCCTRHNPKAFSRLFGGTVYKAELAKGLPLYWLETTEVFNKQGGK